MSNCTSHLLAMSAFTRRFWRPHYDYLAGCGSYVTGFSYVYHNS